VNGFGGDSQKNIYKTSSSGGEGESLENVVGNQYTTPKVRIINKLRTKRSYLSGD
jgi:hypothetical protein